MDAAALMIGALCHERFNMDKGWKLEVVAAELGLSFEVFKPGQADDTVYEIPAIVAYQTETVALQRFGVRGDPREFWCGYSRSTNTLYVSTFGLYPVMGRSMNTVDPSIYVLGFYEASGTGDTTKGEYSHDR